MRYQKFRADNLFTGYDMLGADQVLVTSPSGVIEEIVPFQEAGEDIRVVPGILSPGFVNCHCHLELSHLRNVVPEKTGLVDFVCSVVNGRQASEEIIQEAISLAEESMIARGIVAIGDICNDASSFWQKRQQRLGYYNFIEVTGWSPGVAASRFRKSRLLLDQLSDFLSPEQMASMAPHAPYSVSDPLWELIQPYFESRVTTMHNQETRGENQFFLTGGGDLPRMYAQLNIPNDFFIPTGKTSLQTCLGRLRGAHQVILVHNTFMPKEDMRFLAERPAEHPAVFLCLCPNANLYIENALPPVDLFREQKLALVIGTDSLASNHDLDILSEISTISRHFPAVPLEEMLGWATLNGARALQMDQWLGSFEAGKKPGIVAVTGVERGRLSTGAMANRIL